MNFLVFDLNPSEKIVLDTIRRSIEPSKSRIVEKSNLPWATVTAAVNSLSEKELINCKSKDGRDKVELNTGNYFIGISLGSSNIKVSITSMSCTMLSSEEFEDGASIIKNITQRFMECIGYNDTKETLFNYKTDKAAWCFSTPDNYVEWSNLLSTITLILLEEFNLNIVAMCFVFPGHIDINNQRIIESSYSNLVIKTTNIESLLDNKVLDKIKERNISLFIDHNVKAATSFELSNIIRNTNSYYSENLAVMYMGLGIGMGIVINGQLYRGGLLNLAGQFGYVYVNKVSDEFILDYFNGAIENDKEYAYTVITKRESNTLENVLREDVFYKLLGKNNEKSEKQRYKETYADKLRDKLSGSDDIYRKKIAYYLGNEICNVVRMLSFNTFVFSGKLAVLYPAFKAELQYVIMNNNCQNGVNIIVSENGEFSAALGAAEMAYRNKFGISGAIE